MIGMLLIQWIHVFLAVYWFGGTIYVNTIVIPNLIKMPVSQSRPFTSAISKSSSKIFPIVQTLVIVFGVLRGTMFGPINSASELTSGYGLRFLVSLILTVLLAGFSHGVTGRTARKLGELPVDEVMKGSGPAFDEYKALANKIKGYSVFQLLLFVTIFTLMIMMRFGM